jgi:hypothetical protein
VATQIQPEIVQAIQTAVKDTHTTFVYGNAAWNSLLIIVLAWFIRGWMKKVCDTTTKLWHHTTTHGHVAQCKKEECNPIVDPGRVISPPN